MLISGIITVASMFDAARTGPAYLEENTLYGAIAEALCVPDAEPWLKIDSVRRYLTAVTVAWANLSGGEFAKSDYLFAPGIDIGSPEADTAQAWKISADAWAAVHGTFADIACSPSLSTGARELAAFVALRGELNEARDAAVKSALTRQSIRPLNPSWGRNGSAEHPELPPALPDRAMWVRSLMLNTSLAPADLESALKRQGANDFIGVRFLLHEFGYRALWHGQHANLMEQIVSAAAQGQPHDRDHTSPEERLLLAEQARMWYQLKLGSADDQFLQHLLDIAWCKAIVTPPFMLGYQRLWPQLWLPIANSVEQLSDDPQTLMRARRLRSWCRSEMAKDVAETELVQRTLLHRRRAFLRSLTVVCVPVAVLLAMFVLISQTHIATVAAGFVLALLIAQRRRAVRLWAVLPWRHCFIAGGMLAVGIGAPHVIVAGAQPLDWVAIGTALVLVVLALRVPTIPALPVGALLDPDGALPSDVAASLDELGRRAFK